MANEFVTRTGLIVSGSAYLPTATSASKGHILSFDTSTKEVYYMSTSSVTVTVPGSDTQVIYNNGGAFGAASNFVFSGSNVGIGKTSPTVKLDVSGSVLISGSLTVSGSSTFTNIGPAVFTGSITQNASTASFGGVVGIGTTSPLTTLEVRTSLNSTIPPLSGVPDASTTLLIGNTGTNGVLAIGHDNAGHPWLQGRSVLAGQSPEDILINPLGGNVGIGTTSPTAKLEVIGEGSGSVKMGSTGFGGDWAGISLSGNLNTTNYNLLSSATNTSFFLNRPNGGDMLFRHNNVDQMIIKSAGNVGIGTTSPNARLDVSGSVLISGSLTVSGSSTFTNIGPAVFTGSITQNASTASFGGVVGIGTTTPAYKLDVNGTGRFVGNSGAPALQINDGGSTFSVLGISGSQAGDVNWLLMSGYPNAGNFTIRQSDTVNALVIEKTTGAATFSNSVTAVGLSSTTSAAGNLNSLIRNTVTAASATTGYGLAIESEASAATSYALTVRNLAASTTYFHISTETGKVGFVGIGTTTPSNTLQVVGGVTATSFTGSFSGSVSAPGSTTQIVYNSGGALAADSGLVYSGSRVGVGTANPSASLNIASDGNTQFTITRTNASNSQQFNINVESDSQTSISYDSNSPLVIGTSTNPGTQAGFTERMRITSGGNVGIGTTTPGSKLEVAGTNPFVRINNSSTSDSGIKISYGNSDTHGLHLLYNPGSAVSYIDNTYPTSSGQVYGDMYFRQNAGGTMTSRIVIKAESGNVGIGTTTPGAARLNVVSDNNSNNPIIEAYALNLSQGMGLAYSGLQAIGSNADVDIVITPKGTGKSYFSIGNVGIGTTSPASKLHVSGASATIRVDDTAAGNPGFEIMSGGSTQASLIANTTSGNTTLLVPAGSLTLRAAVGNVFITGSTFQTGSGTITGDLTVGGTITAQKLNVQQITSSVIYSSGSNIFGNSLANTQTFTGSIQATGSTHYFLGDVGIGTTSPISGQGTPLTLASSTGYVGLTLSGSGAYSHLWQLYASGDGGSNKFFGIYDSTNAAYRLVTTSAGNVGIGTTSPANKLYVSATVEDYVAVIENLGTGTAKNGLWIKTDSSFTNSTVLKVTGTTSDSETLQVNPGQVRIGPGSIGQFDGTLFLTSSAPTVANFVASNSSALFISGSGNVGIGTTSPAAKLTVDGTTYLNLTSDYFGSPTKVQLSSGGGSNAVGIQSNNTYLYPYSSDTPVNLVYGYNGGSSWNLTNTGNTRFDFYSYGASATIMALSSSGNVGIGTTSPSNTLQVVGGVTATSFTGSFSGSVAAPGSTTQVVFNSGGALAADSGLVYSGSRVGIGTTAPQTLLTLNGSNVGYAGQLQIAAPDFAQITFYSSSVITPGAGNRKASIIYNAANSTFEIANQITSGNLILQGSDSGGGNVGVGVDVPNYKLEISGSTNVYGRLDVGTGIDFPAGTSNAIATFKQAGSVGGIILQEAGGTSNDRVLKLNSNGDEQSIEATYRDTGPYGNLVFKTGGSNRMFISSSGNVGIGTITPSQSLSVNGAIESLGDGFSEGGQLILRGTTYRYNIDNYNGQALRFFREDDATLGGGTVLMYVSASGNIGIGTTSPSAKLDIAGSTENRYLEVNAISGFAGLSSGSAAMVEFLNAGDGNTLFIKTSNSVRTDAAPLAVWTDNNPRLLVRNDGNVGIGTTNPAYALDVYNAGASNARVRVMASTNYALLQAQNDSGVLYMGIDDSGGGGFSRGNYSRIIWSSGAYPLVFAVGDAERMRITDNGNVGIGTTTPSQRLHVSGAIAIEAESTTTKYSTTFSGSLTTNTNIASVPTASFKAAFFDYYVASGSVNMRAGTVMSVHNNSTSRYTDTSTGDIGDTSAVDFSTSIVAGSLVLTANISSGTWEVKTAYRAL